ncbi:MAG TPA: ATP-binding protein [Puia sp.]|nr:ATP-binding protein [Puia sp.]
MKKVFLISLSLITLTCSAQTPLADSLKNILQKEPKPIARFNLINQILENEVNNGANIDTSLCIEMVRLAQNLNNDSLLAIGYNMAGSFNARKGDYPTALEFLFKAAPLAEKVNDKRRISSLYFDIALVYIILKNPREAYYYNLKGKENLPEKSNKLYDFMLAQFDRNMIRYYLLNNHPDSVLPYLQHLEMEGKLLKTPVITLPSLFLSGAAYAQLNKKDSAEFYFSKAAGFSDSIKSIGLKWTNDKYYIPYLLQNNRLQEAKIRAFHLLHLGEQHNNLDVKLTAVSFLRKIYDKLNQPDSAYHFSTFELFMKDSVFSENNLNKEEALAFNEKLHTIEAQHQADIKKKQKEENLVLGSIGALLILLIFLFLFQLWARRKEVENKLAGQRDRISKELHDNIGSQLSYISGNIDWLIDAKGSLSHEEELNKLNVVSETSKNIVNDLRETIWAIRKESILLEELSDRIKSLLQEQIMLYPEMEVEIIEDIRKDYCLQPDESLNTYRICQEAISNCLNHSECSKIILKISSDNNKNYYFSISDNGKGFDMRIQKEGHYGLLNMQERAKSSGAELIIESMPGKGSTIILAKYIKS